MTAAVKLLEADWPAPARVRAVTTLRNGGVSEGPWRGLNLGTRCGDLAVNVQANRQLLASVLPSEPAWLRQEHATEVVCLDDEVQVSPTADASWTSASGTVCAVLTADCLPLVLCDRGARCVAVAHAGWRGLAAGVIEATVVALPVAPGELMAWLGPAIGPDAFEVREDVLEAFEPHEQRCFLPNGDRWLGNLFALARSRLAACGIEAVHGGTDCTWSDSQRFFSYRRDGQCGRMATLAWLEN